MQRIYSDEELLASHAYAEPHQVECYRLHGGFDAEGNYLPPRTLHRPRAVEAWRQALVERGGEPLEIGLDLLSGPRYPNFAQQKLLLQHELGQTLWNSLTNIGRTEGRGAVIGTVTPPPFEQIVEADISGWTLGHLRPLFQAHGADEGGIPERGIGGHDLMWFAARDLAFGKERYPLPPAPAAARGSIRAGAANASDAGPSSLESLPAPHAQLLRFLMVLLMIEVRAFLGFEQNERLLRDPELFGDRRREADLAADIVSRIRTDERVHVAYLCNLFGELRNATLRCQDGSLRPGREIIDPAWKRQVHLSKQVTPRVQRREMRDVIQRRVLQHRNGQRLLQELEALTDEGAFED